MMSPLTVLTTKASQINPLLSWTKLQQVHALLHLHLNTFTLTLTLTLTLLAILFLFPFPLLPLTSTYHLATVPTTKVLLIIRLLLGLGAVHFRAILPRPPTPFHISLVLTMGASSQITPLSFMGMAMAHSNHPLHLTATPTHLSCP